MARTLITDPILVPEGDTPTVAFQIVDQDGANITLAQLSTLVLTLYDADAGIAGILNDRYEQNVKNANDVTVSSGGLVTWETVRADTLVLFPRRPRRHDPDVEVHLARFTATWTGGQHTFWVEFHVERGGV